MKYLSIDQFRNALICAADDIIASEPELTEIDTIIGDGDHGTTMKSGFTAPVSYTHLTLPTILLV